MKIHWKKVFYFVFLLGSMFGLKNAVGQNDSIRNKNIESNFSENRFQISGVVRDSSDNSPVPFCNIIIHDKFNRQIAGATSDFDGKFKLYPIPKGNYKIHIAFVGYKPLNKSININSDTLINFKIFSTLEKLPVMCYVMDYKIPLIDKKNTTSGETIGGDDIQRKSGR